MHANMTTTIATTAHSLVFFENPSINFYIYTDWTVAFLVTNRSSLIDRFNQNLLLYFGSH